MSLITKLVFITLVLASLGLSNKASDIRVINGQPVPPGKFNEIVFLHMADHKCTATIVGPRTLLTAAHCIDVAPDTWFEFKGQKYTAFFYQSPLYISSMDDDMAIGFTEKDMVGANPATVGHAIREKANVRFFGYGCDSIAGTGIGVLRFGDSIIQVIGSDVNGYNFTTHENGESGAMICNGDSGGPNFLVENGQLFLVGINRSTDFAGESDFTNLTHPASREFIEKTIEEHGAKVCGINQKCTPWPM